jgi:uncharacterized membrane protein YdbT with pleckstrin-like domain
MMASKLALDPAEREQAWRGYSGWAMLPSFVICLLISLALLTGGWFFEDIRGFGDEHGSYLFFVIVWIIWFVQIARWIYRGSTFCYRLTDKHLLIDRGFLHLPIAPIPLREIALVQWGSNVVYRLFSLGWVTVHLKNGTRQQMSGVHEPEPFAKLIQTQMRAN